MAEARNLGYEIIDLDTYMATANNLLNSIESNKPDIVVAGGHSSTNVYTVQNEEEAIVACHNDQVLAGTQSLFATCLFGAQGVPSIVSKGGIVSAGWASEYSWIVSANAEPASDPKAYSFGRLIIEPMVQVLKSKDWSQWYPTLQKVGNEELAYWRQSNDVDAATIISNLIHDMSNATIAGAVNVSAGGISLLGLAPIVVVAAIVLLAKKI